MVQKSKSTTSRRPLKTYSNKKTISKPPVRSMLEEAVYEPSFLEGHSGDEENGVLHTIAPKRRTKRVLNTGKSKKQALKNLVAKRAAKKVPRRLPVNELQCTLERVHEPEASLEPDIGIVVWQFSNSPADNILQTDQRNSQMIGSPRKASELFQVSKDHLFTGLESQSLPKRTHKTCLRLASECLWLEKSHECIPFQMALRAKKRILLES